MAINKAYLGYVRTNTGRYYLQIPDEKCEWGFFLCDDDQTWDGKFLPASKWEAVPKFKVPRLVRERMDWILDEMEALNAERFSTEN